jgi:hypothetical protein
VGRGRGDIGSTKALTVGTTLFADAGTLSLGSGGSLNGGTVSNSGATVTFSGGTLNGVTWQGPLTIGGSAETATMIGMETLTGAGGTGPGTLSVTGANDVLTVLGTVVDTGGASVNAGTVLFEKGRERNDWRCDHQQRDIRPTQLDAQFHRQFEQQRILGGR